MKTTALPSDARRPYRQTARAEAAEATAERVRDAFAARLREGWFDEIRLDDVARDADVTVQTVIRRFGSKEGLLEAVVARIGEEVQVRREAPLGDVPAVVRAVIADYEASGDLMMRVLAQEDRHVTMRGWTDHGRAEHRAWVARMFAPWLEHEPKDVADRRLNALVVGLDLYVWKLIRRDMRRPVSELQTLMERLVFASLPSPNPESER